MKTTRMYFAAVATTAIVGASIPAAASAQDAAEIACKSSACGFQLDWGSGKTSASYPPDRRYGSGDDFESKFRSAMGLRGYRLLDKAPEGGITVTARPTMKGKVMCDRMAGINPDMNCTAVIALAVNFQSADSKVKAPGAIRINNRCAAGDIFMTNPVFAQYAADMIWYQLEGQAAKAEKPVSNC
jgi:hypothetical protein